MRLLAVIAAAVCLLTPNAYAEGAAEPPPASSVASAPNLVAVDAARGHAVAVGAHGAVYALDRGSGQWRRAASTATAGLRGVSVVSKRHVWAVGIGGYFTHLDRGAWVSPPGSTSKSYNAVAFADRRRGIAVGDEGKVRHWVKDAWYDFSAMAKELSLYDIVRVGRGRFERFIAVGSGGHAVSFRGVGRSLAADIEITGVTDDLTAIDACKGRKVEAIAVGKHAVIRGVDGAWRRLPDPPGALRGVAARCDRGAVTAAYAATDGGLAIYEAVTDSWRMRSLDGAAALNDVTWLDAKRLIAVGARGFARVFEADEITSKQ